MSKTSERKRKWARIIKAQASDSAGIAAGRVQKPAYASKHTAKAGKNLIRANRNESYAYTGARLYSTAQQCWAKMPSWYKK